MLYFPDVDTRKFIKFIKIHFKKKKKKILNIFYLPKHYPTLICSCLMILIMKTFPIVYYPRNNKMFTYCSLNKWSVKFKAMASCPRFLECKQITVTDCHHGEFVNQLLSTLHSTVPHARNFNSYQALFVWFVIKSWN